VREALLGKSLNGKMSLRSRLASSAKQRPDLHDSLNAPGAGGIYPQNAVMFGRREGATGTSVSRRAALPAAALRKSSQRRQSRGNRESKFPEKTSFQSKYFTHRKSFGQKRRIEKFLTR
jgi:hypothetical protein